MAQKAIINCPRKKSAAERALMVWLTHFLGLELPFDRIVVTELTHLGLIGTRLSFSIRCS